MYYVYVIESEKTDRKYIGYSTDLRSRLRKHNAHGNTSTAHDGPWRIIYYEAYINQDDALGREKFLKSGSGWRFLKKQLHHYLGDKNANR